TASDIIFLTAVCQFEVICFGGFKFIQNGRNVSLNCSFLYSESPVVSWFKQTPGEKPVLITSCFRFSSDSQFHNNFNESGRFSAFKGKDTFTLNISNVEASDSATYFCAAAYYTDIELSDCTLLVLKDPPSSLYTVLQPPVSNPVKLGGNTTLQCSILTNRCSEDHSVYWFRHGSGESDPGIIFTHGNRSDQCKKSSETNNLSLSDAGTYYCAVAACGEIFFGNGTEVNFGRSVIKIKKLCLKNKNLENCCNGIFYVNSIHCRNINVYVYNYRIVPAVLCLLVSV
uniref:Ig-like domain-containing protein n=1 Tax=Astyanax mexicanus TaxID=7994 RepID=A0A3B1K3Z0_ASTMX